MLKRLITAVFALGLLMTFTDIAFSGPDPGDATRKEIPRSTVVPTVENLIPISHQISPLFRNGFDAQQVFTTLNGRNGRQAAPDTNACYEQDYTDYAGTSFFYTWTTTAAQFRKLSMRFDVTAMHQATVDYAFAYINKINGAGPTVDLELTIWDDAGGVPGTAIYTEIFPLAVDPGLTTAGGAYFVFPLTTPQVVTSTYHISVARPAGAPATDTLRFWSDDGGDGTATGTARSSYYPNGGPWMTTPAFFGDPAFDPNFIIGSHQCEAYSDCYYNFSTMAFVAGFTLPRSAAPSFHGFAQRFVAEGPETVKTVHFWHGSSPLFGLPPQDVYGPASTNGLIVQVWGDSAGEVHESAGPLGTVIVPGGLATMYPATGNLVAGFEDVMVDMSALNIVVLGGYHVSVRMSSQVLADGRLRFFLNSATSDPGRTGASAIYNPPATVANPEYIRIPAAATPLWPAGFGVGEREALIETDNCRDEFYDCQTKVLYGPSELTDAWFIGSQIVAQKVIGQPVNRLEKVRFAILDETLFGGNPGDNGSPTVDLIVYGSGGAFPATGGPSPSFVQNVPAPVYYPGWNEVVIPGGLQLLGDFFVGYRNTGNTATDYIYQAANADPEVNGGAVYWSGGAMLWRDLGTFAAGYDQNWLIEVDFCSIPVSERPCAADANWATRNGDFQRTGASGLSIGDAHCDLAPNWTYEHPTLGLNFNGPIIYDEMVITAFTSEYVILDLNSGAVLDVISAADHGPSIGGNIRCTPTVDVVDSGTAKPYLFLGGGNTNALSAWDVSSLPATRIWSIGGANPAPPGGSHGTIGGMRYATTVVLQDMPDTAGAPGTTDVVFFTDDNGRMFAARAHDGSRYALFDGNSAAEPDGSPYTSYNLGGTPLISGSTDGERIFVSTFVNGGVGDVLAINAADGTLDWKLSTASGLQGTALTGYANEAFEGGPSVDLAADPALNAVFVNSRIQGVPGIIGAVDGAFYNLLASDGSAVVPAVPTQRQFLSHPIIDAQRVIIPCTWTFNVPAPDYPMGGSLFAVTKASNAVSWVTSSFPAGGVTPAGYRVEGALTCEPNGVADIVVAFDEHGYLGFFDAESGEEIFHRRIDYPTDGGRSVAIGADGTGATHVVVGALWGTVFDLTKQADQARLEILTPSQTLPVPFGSPSDTLISFQNIYYNSGCANLVVDLTASDASNGTLLRTAGGIRTVRSSVAEGAASLADRITLGFGEKQLPVRTTAVGAEDVFEMSRESFEDRGRTRAALATPAFLNENGTYPGDVFDPAGGGIVTAPGDSADITVHANGPLVNRGPNVFYVEFTVHNDPNYFLNDNSIRPEVVLTLVGGCLLDTTLLSFGTGGANDQIVWNTNRLADGDLAIHGFEIGGAGVEVFQGSFVYGISQYRVAMHCPSWQGGATELDDWISAQPDPNFCNADCHPALTTGVSLGTISADGLTYSPLSGNMVCKSYIDSVINYYDAGLGQWNWGINPGDASGFPFDNDSTMGLTVNTRTIGVLNAPAVGASLNSGTLEVMSFRMRDTSRVLNDWTLWSMMDYDIATGAPVDTAAYFGAISTAAAFPNNNTGAAWGMVKIPFGCGEAPMINSKALDAAEAQFYNDPPANGNAYWDSAYGFTNLGIGGHGQNLTAAPDEEAHFTIAEHDFLDASSAEYNVGVVNFRVAGGSLNVASTYEAMANTWNKFAGFGRGDVNNDNVINIADIIHTVDHVNNVGTKPGAFPFAHLSDVNASGATDLADVTYLINYYFNYGPCPQGEFLY